MAILNKYSNDKSTCAESPQLTFQVFKGIKHDIEGTTKYKSTINLSTVKKLKHFSALDNEKFFQRNPRTWSFERPPKVVYALTLWINCFVFFCRHNKQAKTVKHLHQ